MKSTRVAENGRPLGLVTPAAALLVLGLSLAVLCEWGAGLIRIAAVSDRFVPMAPATAAGFAVLGAVLLLRRRLSRGLPRAVLGAAAAAVVLLGLSILGELVLLAVRGVHLDLERVLVAASRAPGGFTVGRMSPLTALLFVVMGGAVLGSFPGRDGSSARRWPQVTTAVALWLAGVLVVGYWYGAPLLYGGDVIPVALPTAASFVVLGVGLLFDGPGALLTRVMTSTSVFARITRTAVPWSVLLVLLAGRLAMEVLRRGSPPDLVVFFAVGSLATAMLLGLVTVFMAQRVGVDLSRAEQARRASEARHELALEGGDLGTWDWNIPTGDVTFNERWASMLGFALDEIEPTVAGWETLLHPDDRDGVMEALEAHLAGEAASYETEHRLRRKDGGWVWVLDKGRVIDRDAQGRPLRACGTHLDITERREAEQALRQRAEFIETILESAPLGFAVTSTVNGSAQFVSARFEEIYRVPRGSLSGVAGFFDTVYRDPVFREEIRNRVLGDIASGDPERMRWEEIPVVMESGETRYVTASNIPLPEQHLMVSTVQDVTSRRRAEDALREAQKIEAVGRLAGGLAHDFNNILQALMSLGAVLLANSGERSRVEACAREMDEYVRRGAALTRQLLLFARGEVTRAESVDLCALVADGLRLLRRLVRQSVRFEIALSSTPCWVEGDPSQLDQVLMNLVVNAADAVPGTGTVTVRVEGREGGEVVLEVADSGTGMTPDVQARIFEPFFTTKGRERGTGLGLPVVHGIVTRHQGSIEVESTPGVGSRFRVVLPAAPRNGAEPAPDVDGEAEPGHGEAVLLVEDEEGARRSLAEILSLLGYRVTTAASGEEALLEEGPFDLLLTDLLLPGMNGRELAAEMVERSPDLRVVTMSGFTDDEEVLRDARGGRMRFLRKPFGIALLAAELRSALE